MSAHSRGSWPRHQVLYKMMNNRPKHQFLENQHFLDMLELCVQASAAVKTKKRVVATTSSLVIHIQHQLSRFEMQWFKIIALSSNLFNSLHSKKTTTVALFCFFHFSSPSSSLLSDNYNAFLMFNMLTNLSFFLPQRVANTLHGVLWIRWDNKLEENWKLEKKKQNSFIFGMQATLGGFSTKLRPRGASRRDRYKEKKRKNIWTYFLKMLQVLAILNDVTSALGYLHNRRIIHRYLIVRNIALASHPFRHSFSNCISCDEI